MNGVASKKKGGTTFAISATQSAPSFGQELVSHGDETPEMSLIQLSDPESLRLQFPHHLKRSSSPLDFQGTFRVKGPD